MMKIKCPGCSAEFVLDASMSGQVIDCTCGKQLRVPSSPSAGSGREGLTSDAFPGSTSKVDPAIPAAGGKTGVPESPGLGNLPEVEANPSCATQEHTQNPFAAPVNSDAQTNPYASPGGAQFTYQALPQGYAIASLVLGITSLVTTLLCCGGFIFAIPAIVCGVIGIKQAKQGVAGGRGMAVAGLVIGVVILALTLIGVLIYAGMVFFTIQQQGL